MVNVPKHSKINGVYQRKVKKWWFNGTGHSKISLIPNGPWPPSKNATVRHKINVDALVSKCDMQRASLENTEEFGYIHKQPIHTDYHALHNDLCTYWRRCTYIGFRKEEWWCILMAKRGGIELICIRAHLLLHRRKRLFWLILFLAWFVINGFGCDGYLAIMGLHHILRRRHQNRHQL